MPTSCILYVAVKAIMIDLCANSLPYVLHSCCIAVMVLQGSEYTTRDGNGVDSKEYVQTQKVYFIDVESIDNIKKDLFSGYKDVLLDGEKQDTLPSVLMPYMMMMVEYLMACSTKMISSTHRYVSCGYVNLYTCGCYAFVHH